VAVSDSNPAYSVEGNVSHRMLDDGLHLIFSPSSNEFSEYAVKEGTVRIGKGAFKNNAALTSVKLPEGLKEIEAGAFSGCRALARVDFPDSLERVNGIPNSLIEVAEFGSNIVEIKRTAFSGHNPAHLIVRGGKNGSYASSSESGPDKRPLKSVYLGEGMVKADFGIYDVAPPAVLVVPSTLTELSLRSAGEFPGASGPVIYAPKSSAGWNAAVSALRDAGYDVSDAKVLSAHLKAYKPLEGRFAFDAAPQPSRWSTMPRRMRWAPSRASGPRISAGPTCSEARRRCPKKRLAGYRRRFRPTELQRGVSG
ncbi:MAG: leucine-rich repeat domain-containing protein, partial [Berryella intestinalis]|uniref:leucine-rich repeat domain-containing protein n=1 Tax=Berryella intestinalis TaxID=1531429 RepID=UPI002A75E59E